jgi:hypothetical protein
MMRKDFNKEKSRGGLILVQVPLAAMLELNHTTT